jgi:hypothetical protein
MDRETLLQYVKDELNECIAMFEAKNSSYGQDDEALHNFIVGAVLQNSTLQQTLGGYLAKHIASVYDLINEGKDIETTRDMDIWHEKITDSIVYLSILHAICITELHHNQPACIKE